jgi:hypothetical protein
VITVVARKGKGRQIYEKTRSIPHGPNDFFLHGEFIFSRIPGSHDLEGQICPLSDVVSHPDSREAAMAEFMLYAVCLGRHFPDAKQRIGWQKPVGTILHLQYSSVPEPCEIRNYKIPQQP